MEKIINTLFPPKCVFCGSIGDIFCENCISNCLLLLEQRCIICDKPSVDGITHEHCYKPGMPTQVLSVFVYGDNVRNCIKKSKYSSRLFMCLKRLSFEGVNLAYEWGYNFKDFVVVSIPVSKEKQKLRGFNQVDVISKSFSKRFNLKINNSLLIRVRDTKSQHSSSRKQRFKNVADSFLSPSNVKGKKVILIDDITTTGATFLEASKVLYQAGAIEVKCFSLSKKL
ncbi:ComF family protein [candidate division WWE3 bacterium]|uniref:ComF family protein n=1 Tax=candidate division WWE3 bacterium TaxID=2053526 RepID=A0A7X9E7H0_UNCKA|nr:ComF family protein [candidate division WWE3 bacterium]